MTLEEEAAATLNQAVTRRRQKKQKQDSKSEVTSRDDYDEGKKEKAVKEDLPSPPSLLGQIGSTLMNTFVYPRQLRQDAPLGFFLLRYAIIATLFFTFYYLYRMFIFNPLYSVTTSSHRQSD